MARSVSEKCSDHTRVKAPMTSGLTSRLGRVACSLRNASIIAASGLSIKSPPRYEALCPVLGPQPPHHASPRLRTVHCLSPLLLSLYGPRCGLRARAGLSLWRAPHSVSVRASVVLQD